MNRSLGVVLCLSLFCATALAQSAPCTVSDHTQYSKKIKEFTTEPVFSTELVDHLPLSSCVPAPDAFLHHIVGAPDVLDYTKDINAYMRLLASKSPRVKVWSIGMSEEGREMLVVAVSDEANLARLDRYKEITARLADPRGLSEAEAQKLIAEGKPIYWADGSIHSPGDRSAGDADGAGIPAGRRRYAVHPENPQRLPSFLSRPSWKWTGTTAWSTFTCSIKSIRTSRRIRWCGGGTMWRMTTIATIWA